MQALCAWLGTRLRVVRRQVRSASYLRKWVILGALIGVVGGFGAIVFYTALEVATQFFLGFLGGYAPPSPAGEGGAPITGFARAWALPFVVTLGGLISGIIVYRFAPEAEGHGTDAAIAAYHHNPRGIRGRIPLVKLVASAVTIGSGGSGGREGPLGAELLYRDDVESDCPGWDTRQGGPFRCRSSMSARGSSSRSSTTPISSGSPKSPPHGGRPARHS